MFEFKFAHQRTVTKDKLRRGRFTLLSARVERSVFIGLSPPLVDVECDLLRLILFRYRWFGSWTHRIQGCGAIDPRSNAGSPLTVILLAQPTAFNGAAVLGTFRSSPTSDRRRRPALTAPARDSLPLSRVGMKEQAFRSNKETKDGSLLLKLLDKKSSIQGVQSLL